MTNMTFWDKILHIDLETYSETDLTRCGVYKYVEDPTFEIMLIAYAWNDEPVQIIDLAQGEEIPADIIAALCDPEILKMAHNANFERTCLAQALGVAMPPEQWECTAVRAATLGLPRSLESVGEILGLSEDERKMKAGKSLINYFSKPCPPTLRNGGRTRNLPHHDPDRWALYKQYCMQDVETERHVYEALKKYPETPTPEKELWYLDQKIIDKGALVDMQLVDNILEYYQSHTEALIERAQEITGLGNPKSVSQVKGWLEEQGLEVESLNKDSVKELLDTTKNDDVIEMLEIRQELGKTSVSKYEAMKRAACNDNRIRGMLLFYGANKTGRWSGRIVQLQNLPKNTLEGEDLALARSIILEKDFELLEMLYDSPMDLFSQLIRTALIPKEGHVFIVADYSAIEARVLSWLANEKWRMEVFATHGKIYEASAAQMFKIPIESIDKGSPERAKGKVAELALGYQGATGALKAMGAEEMGLTDREISSLVTTWRNTNPAIVDFWRTSEKAAREAVMNPGLVTRGPRGIEYEMILDTLFIKLPSGRRLAYKNARIKRIGTRTSLVHDEQNQNSNKWEESQTYGGKIVENITQAVARDCLAAAMMKLDKAGYTPTFHVHDEVVIEVPKEKAQEALKEITQLMAIDLDWTKGLILKAEAFTTEYYMKD